MSGRAVGPQSQSPRRPRGYQRAKERNACSRSIAARRARRGLGPLPLLVDREGYGSIGPRAPESKLARSLEPPREKLVLNWYQDRGRRPRRGTKKPRLSGAFCSSGGGIRTRDLRVMSELDLGPPGDIWRSRAKSGSLRSPRFAQTGPKIGRKLLTVAVTIRVTSSPPGLTKARCLPPPTRQSTPLLSSGTT